MFFSVFKAPRCRCSATCWLFTRWGSLKLTWNRPKQGTNNIYSVWHFLKMMIFRTSRLVGSDMFSRFLGGYRKNEAFSKFSAAQKETIVSSSNAIHFQIHRFIISSLRFAAISSSPAGTNSCLGGWNNRGSEGETTNMEKRIVSSWCFVKDFLRSSSIQMVMLCHVCCCKILWNKTVLRVYQIFYVFLNVNQQKMVWFPRFFTQEIHETSSPAQLAREP